MPQTDIVPAEWTPAEEAALDMMDRAWLDVCREMGDAGRSNRDRYLRILNLLAAKLVAVTPPGRERDACLLLGKDFWSIFVSQMREVEEVRRKKLREMFPLP